MRSDSSLDAYCGIGGRRGAESSGFRKGSVWYCASYNVDSGACFKVLERHQFTVSME